MLNLRLVTFFVIVLQTITAFNGCIRTPQEPPQSGEIIVDFTSEGYTLIIATSCKSSVQKCPFQAEISTAPGNFGSIEKVEYTFVSDSTKSLAPITRDSPRFIIKAEQTGGGKVNAAVTLKSRDGVPSKVVQIEGTIPFASEVTPSLPAGLRFEVNYQPWYLEGVPHEPVEYLFKIQLLGDTSDSDALKRIKSVEYKLPADEAKRPRITHSVESEYFVEGSMPANKEGVVIIAVIRWKSGETSTHTIPLRPRS